MPTWKNLRIFFCMFSYTFSSFSKRNWPVIQNVQVHCNSYWPITQANNRKSILSLFQRHSQVLLQDVPDIENLNSPIDQINAIEEDKLQSYVRDCFNKLWKTEIASFPKANTFMQFKDTVKATGGVPGQKNFFSSFCYMLQPWLSSF